VCVPLVLLQRLLSRLLPKRLTVMTQSQREGRGSTAGMSAPALTHQLPPSHHLQQQQQPQQVVVVVL
jgi:hypothetical protein